MGIGGVIEDRIQQEPHAPPGGLRPQIGQGLVTAQMRVHVLEVLRVVFVDAR